MKAMNELDVNTCVMHPFLASAKVRSTDEDVRYGLCSGCWKVLLEDQEFQIDIDSEISKQLRKIRGN